MKIKPSTLFLLLAALILGGIVLVVQQQPAPKSADSKTDSKTEVAADPQPIFGIREADIQAFTLQTRLRTLKFERDKDGKWQMLEPSKTAASEPSIAFLLDLVATGQSDRTLTVPASDREQYGLHQPIATIDLRLKDQKTHKLVIGEYDFNRSHLYAQADPPPNPPANPSDPIKLLLVSPNFDNAVNRPLDEWKQPAAAQKTNTEKSTPGKAQPPVASPSSPSSASPSPSTPPSPSPSPSAAPKVKQ